MTMLTGNGTILPPMEGDITQGLMDEAVAHDEMLYPEFVGFFVLHELLVSCLLGYEVVDV